MDLLQALGEVVAFLEKEQVPYVLIGGLAVQHWGEPRATRDIDITVLMDEADLERFLERVLTRFRARLPDAVRSTGAEGGGRRRPTRSGNPCTRPTLRGSHGS